MLGEAPRTIARGSPAVGPAAARLTRLPDGCPEGFLEGFANLYGDAAELIWARLEGRAPDPDAALLPRRRRRAGRHAVHRGGAGLGQEQRRLDETGAAGSERIVVSESSQAKAGPRRRLRLGMVGGGQGAFIGGVHRIAARLDGRYELVAGAFSSTAEKSKASGEELGIDPTRCYGDFAEMAKREARRKDGIDVVAIVTPNNVHFAAAKAFLERGIHVICDKPLTTTLKDARKLAELVEQVGLRLRADPQLYRLPDGAAGPGDGGRRRSWARSGWCRPSTPRTG